MTSASNASGARARADDYEGSTRLRQSGGRHRIGGSSNDSELSSSPSRCWKESAAIDIPGKGIKEAWNGSHEYAQQSLNEMDMRMSLSRSRSKYGTVPMSTSSAQSWSTGHSTSTAHAAGARAGSPRTSSVVVPNITPAYSSSVYYSESYHNHHHGGGVAAGSEAFFTPSSGRDCVVQKGRLARRHTIPQQVTPDERDRNNNNSTYTTRDVLAEYPGGYTGYDYPGARSWAGSRVPGRWDSNGAFGSSERYVEEEEDGEEEEDEGGGREEARGQTEEDVGFVFEIDLEG